MNRQTSSTIQLPVISGSLVRFYFERLSLTCVSALRPTAIKISFRYFGLQFTDALVVLWGFKISWYMYYEENGMSDIPSRDLNTPQVNCACIAFPSFHAEAAFFYI